MLYVWIFVCTLLPLHRSPFIYSILLLYILCKVNGTKETKRNVGILYLNMRWEFLFFRLPPVEYNRMIVYKIIIYINFKDSILFLSACCGTGVKIGCSTDKDSFVMYSSYVNKLYFKCTSFMCHIFSSFFLRHLMIVFVFVPQEEKAMTLDSRMLWVLYSFKFVHFGCDVATCDSWPTSRCVLFWSFIFWWILTSTKTEWKCTTRETKQQKVTRKKRCYRAAQKMFIAAKIRLIQFFSNCCCCRVGMNGKEENERFELNCIFINYIMKHQ